MIISKTAKIKKKLFLKDPNTELLKKPIITFLNELRQQDTSEVKKNLILNILIFFFFFS